MEVAFLNCRFWDRLKFRSHIISLPVGKQQELSFQFSLEIEDELWKELIRYSLSSCGEVTDLFVSSLGWQLVNSSEIQSDTELVHLEGQ